MKNKQETKGMVLERQNELAKKMLEGKGYHLELEWYIDEFGKSEKSFGADRTVIYRKWKIENSKSIEDKKTDYLNALAADRELARTFGQIGASINATKLMAQIDGIINKQNEPLIAIQNNTMNLEAVGTSELLTAIEELKKLQNGT